MSLFQKDPSSGKRTSAEEAAFSRALKVMGLCYASITGTTVLQFKDPRLERPYDMRGWPCFEQGASFTVAAHLAAAERQGSLPKRFKLAQESRPKVIEISGGKMVVPEINGSPKTLLERAQKAVDEADFTGKGDREVVKELLADFSSIVDSGLSKWLQRSAGAAKPVGAADDLGAVVLEMAGACWVLPEFYGKLEGRDEELISTLKKTTTAELIAASLESQHASTPRGGSVSQTNCREEPHCDSGVVVRGWAPEHPRLQHGISC
jgi:hypothetical protein